MRRRWHIGLVGLLFASLLWAAVAYVQSAINAKQGQSGATATVTISGVTAGNLLVVTVDNESSSAVDSMTDTAGNTFAKAVTVTSGSNSVDIWYAANAKSGNTTITMTATGSAGIFAAVMEYSGMATTTPLDKTITGTGTSNTNVAVSTPATATTTQANELIVAFFEWTTNCALGNAPTAGSGFTARQTADWEPWSWTDIAEDKIVSATGAYTASAAAPCTSGATWMASVATFKASGATSSPTIRRKVLSF